MTHTEDRCNIHTEPPQAEYPNFFGHWQEVVVMSDGWSMWHAPKWRETHSVFLVKKP